MKETKCSYAYYKYSDVYFAGKFSSCSSSRAMFSSYAVASSRVATGSKSYTCQLFNVIHRRDIFILRLCQDFSYGTDNFRSCPTVSEDVRKFPKTFRRLSDLWPVNQCLDDLRLYGARLDEYDHVSSDFPC